MKTHHVIACPMTTIRGCSCLSASVRLQREQLEQSADLAGDTRRVTRDARRTLKAIAWKVFREKLTLIGTIACLLAIDFALAYRLVSNHGRL